MKIVINKCFGGFSLSKKAVEFMANLGSSQARAELNEIPSRDNNYDSYYGYSKEFESEYDRSDSNLVLAVETLGCEANGCFSKLKVVEIPEGVNWEIINHDGLETVHEKHRIWS